MRVIDASENLRYNIFSNLEHERQRILSDLKSDGHKEIRKKR
jgi:hypothetical protein